MTDETKRAAEPGDEGQGNEQDPGAEAAASEPTDAEPNADDAEPNADDEEPADGNAAAGEDDEDDGDDEDGEGATSPEALEASSSAAPPDDEHGGAPGSHGEEHGISHVVPLSVLAAIFGALVVLTVLTVAVTTFDLGPAGNLWVAMIIATVKAGLVIAVFMHLLYDRSINLLLFLTSILFVVLFISLLMIDRAEYQPSIDQLEATQEAQTSEG